MLAAQARHHGLSVDEYLRFLLPQANDESDEKPLYESATLEEWVHAFHGWAANHAVLPAIADDSRETIYQGRGE